MVLGVPCTWEVFTLFSCCAFNSHSTVYIHNLESRCNLFSTWLRNTEKHCSSVFLSLPHCLNTFCLFAHSGLADITLTWGSALAKIYFYIWELNVFLLSLLNEKLHFAKISKWNHLQNHWAFNVYINLDLFFKLADIFFYNCGGHAQLPLNMGYRREAVLFDYTYIAALKIKDKW